MKILPIVNIVFYIFLTFVCKKHFKNLNNRTVKEPLYSKHEYYVL